MIRSPLVCHRRLQVSANIEQMGRVRPGDVLADSSEPSTPSLRRFARYSSSRKVNSQDIGPSRALYTNGRSNNRQPPLLSPGISPIREGDGNDRLGQIDTLHETEKNWQLRDHGPPLPGSMINSGNITIVPVSDDQNSTSGSSVKSSLRLRIEPFGGGSLRNHQLTSGQLKLVRSGSLGVCVQPEENVDDERVDLKCQPTCRKPVFGLFESGDDLKRYTRSEGRCCHCVEQNDCDGSNWPIATSSPVPQSNGIEENRYEQLPPDTVNKEEQEPIHSTYIESLDLSEFDDSRLSYDDRLKSMFHYRSCPDLIEPCIQQEVKSYQTLALGDRMRRAKHKQRTAAWKRKAVRDWTLDDTLMWLQHMGMDDIASVLIGYDLTGAEVDCWDAEALEKLGVSNSSDQKLILKELKFHKDMITREKVRKHKKHSQYLRVPLFNLVRASSYDQIVATELYLNARDITVAEGVQGCLQVTKAQDRIRLKPGDCILEINSQPTQFMAAVDFTKVVSETVGQPVQLVVLRRTFDPPSPGSYSPQSISSAEVSTSICSSDATTDTTESDNEFQILHF